MPSPLVSRPCVVYSSHFLLGSYTSKREYGNLFLLRSYTRFSITAHAHREHACAHMHVHAHVRVRVCVVPHSDLALRALSGVRLVLLDPMVERAQSHIIVHVKVEERPRLAPRPGENEIVKGDAVRHDEVLLDINEVRGRARAQRNLPTRASDT